VNIYTKNLTKLFLHSSYISKIAKTEAQTNNLRDHLREKVNEALSVSYHFKFVSKYQFM
jgi:hypothetical protein